MSSSGANPKLSWHGIHTHPKQEDRAERNLRAWQVETFSPKLSAHRISQFTGDSNYTIEPLFPTYIFAKFNVSQLLHKVRFTRGVHSIICFGPTPTPIDEEVIVLIRSRIGEDGLVRIGERLSPGDEIMIKEGPLRKLVGVFEHEMEDSHRVIMLLNTLNYQAHVIVQRENVKKIA